MIRRIQVVFNKDLFFPRFKMLKGESWEVRVDRLQKEGFPLGNGFVNNYDFDVTGVKNETN